MNIQLLCSTPTSGGGAWILGVELGLLSNLSTASGSSDPGRK